mmetsp:Transcript_13849/g.29872  ORF Transcript_13849/g.29872 Transcript_13849/m.29872 type:complete len:273 (+) Transcript_13849:164-982(+)
MTSMHSSWRCIAQPVTAAPCSSVRYTSIVATQVVRRKRHVMCGSSPSSSQSSFDFGESARQFSNNFTRNAQDQVNNFVREAKPKVEDAVEEMKQTARRSYKRLDTEFDISGRAEKAGRRLEEAAKDVDQTYRVRRRIRNFAEWLGKKWPIWAREFEEFSATTHGKVVILVALCAIMTTPLFWRLLHWMLFLWWASIPLSVLLVGNARKKQEERMAQMQAEAEERRRNPFGNMFKGKPWGSTGSSQGAKRNSSSKQQQGGPVIDAEWYPVDKK